MARMKHQAIVGNIGHFDNEIDIAGLGKVPGIERVNIKPQVDEWRFPDGHTIGANAAASFRVESRGETRLERLVSLVLLGDLVSLYLAVLRGIDPTPVDAIERLKGALIGG
jgi:Bacterial phospho-glucose isomerase C-terminal SIS domain/S-adenosyl-L-homocysteine hydrolase, NAD binding domain